MIQLIFSEDHSDCCLENRACMGKGGDQMGAIAIAQTRDCGGLC